MNNINTDCHRPSITSLCSSRKWRIEFTVTGAMSFPVDMLRYDTCFPATSEDAVSIVLTERSLEQYLERRAIRLVKYGSTRADFATVGRWASFGWKVES